MAGFSIRTGVDAETAFKTARRAAKDLGFTVRNVGDWEFVAQKGNLIASIFVGAFVAYCDFHVFVEENKKGAVEISIQRNTPWWTGAIGVHRVNNAAEALADGIDDAIEADGGKVLNRGTF
jgi:hypothetical protein